jgi:hypothetical protein
MSTQPPEFGQLAALGRPAPADVCEKAHLSRFSMIPFEKRVFARKFFRNLLLSSQGADASAPIPTAATMDILLVLIVAILFLGSFALCQSAGRTAARVWSLYAKKAAH